MRLRRCLFWSGLALALGIGSLGGSPRFGGAEEERGIMTDQQILARTWVEVREESQPGRIVFRPADAKLPPARGRRWLDLSEPGHAVAKSPGPADKMEGVAGAWSVRGRELSVTAPGWSGTYQIEELTEHLLVLRPK